jgi:hypothetical protein
MAKVRKGMVRERAETLVSTVDTLLAVLAGKVERDGTHLADDAQWQEIVAGIAEIQRLLADDFVTKAIGAPSLGTFTSVRALIYTTSRRATGHLCGATSRPRYIAELEPLPVQVDDLSTLAASRPQGTVTTALDSSALDGDGCERLIFNLLTDAAGHENTRRPMATSAPDRGRAHLH